MPKHCHSGANDDRQAVFWNSWLDFLLRHAWLEMDEDFSKKGIMTGEISIRLDQRAEVTIQGIGHEVGQFLGAFEGRAEEGEAPGGS